MSWRISVGSALRSGPVQGRGSGRRNAPSWIAAAIVLTLLVQLRPIFSLRNLDALVLALMPDAKFDARFNPGSPQANASGWDAVLVAIATAVVVEVLMNVFD